MADQRRSHLRLLPAGSAAPDGTPEPGAQAGYWYVRVTFGGAPVQDDSLVPALRRLTEANPVGMTVRYAPNRAEVSYWDEAPDAEDAAAMALRVWNEHRTELGLPDWQVTALEVLDRDTCDEREYATPGLSLISSVTRLHP